MAAVWQRRVTRQIAQRDVGIVGDDGFQQGTMADYQNIAVTRRILMIAQNSFYRFDTSALQIIVRLRTFDIEVWFRVYQRLHHIGIGAFYVTPETALPNAEIDFFEFVAKDN